MTYSLWLGPEERQTARLQEKINRLAEACGSEPFAPHVTVSSGLQHKPSSEALRLLAKRHPKPTLAALRVQHSERHYQCLSLALRRDRALMALRADALSTLGGRESIAPYQPHISLLYAKLSAARRAKLAKQIPAIQLKRCLGSKLQLVLTNGPEKQWQVIDQVELGDDA